MKRMQKPNKVMTMTDDQIIAAKERRILELESRNKSLTTTMQEIRAIIICIGGPLNDNKLEYTKEQRGPFRQILKLVESVL